MKNILTLIAVSFIWTSNYGQQIDLKLNLEKGKEYKQITNSKSKITQEIEGQVINIEMILRGNMSYLVTAVHEDDYEMEVRYKSLMMSMQLPQGNIEFNSEKNDEQDVFSMILAEMKNIPFQITMTKRGKVTDVKNVDTLFESAFKKFPQLPKDQMEQIKAQLMKAYGKKAFKGSIEMVTAIYPDSSVKQGESWKINTKLEAGFSSDMTSNYQFSANKSDHYFIVGFSTIKTTDKDAYIKSNGIAMKYNMTGNMSSEIKIDKISGWIIEAKINQEIEGDVYFKENSEMPNGMKVPMSMKNDMTFSNQ